MRAVIPCLAWLPWLMLVSSCSSPPKPPTVDESMKRPVNSQTAVELQVCKNDLQNTRILAAESGRLAESTAATLASVAMRQQLLAVMQAPSPSHTRANSVHSIHFEFGSTRVAIPVDVTAAMVEEAKAAPLVLLRGRTDGASDSPAESRIARERAAAVRDHLVSAGVDATRIRTTYQPFGDHAADNSKPEGRAGNRRVEIEIYRALPVAVHATAPVQP